MNSYFWSVELFDHVQAKVIENVCSDNLVYCLLTACSMGEYRTVGQSRLIKLNCINEETRELSWAYLDWFGVINKYFMNTNGQITGEVPEEYRDPQTGKVKWT